MGWGCPAATRKQGSVKQWCGGVSTKMHCTDNKRHRSAGSGVVQLSREHVQGQCSSSNTPAACAAAGASTPPGQLAQHATQRKQSSTHTHTHTHTCSVRSSRSTTRCAAVPASWPRTPLARR